MFDKAALPSMVVLPFKILIILFQCSTSHFSYADCFEIQEHRNSLRTLASYNYRDITPEIVAGTGEYLNALLELNCTRLDETAIVITLKRELLGGDGDIALFANFVADLMAPATSDAP